jgi:hypothetical protein
VSAASLILPGTPGEHLEIRSRLTGRDPVNCVRAIRVAGLAGRPEEQLELVRACGTMPSRTVRECQEWLGRALTVVSNGRFAQEGCARLTSTAQESCRAGAGESRTPLITFA